jgi:transposase
MSDRKKLKMISSTNAVEAARAGTASAVSTAATAPMGAPDPEVRAVAKRRQFNAAYKLSVLEEADRCTSPGAIGALLRREGLYSSHLAMWRRERVAGTLAALGRRRGRKAKLTPEQRRIAALEAGNARLERELEQARTIIGVQKKLCTLLGLPTAESTEDSGSES